MRPILPSTPNAYTGNPLDRAGEKRGDEAWVQARRGDPDSLFLPLWRGRVPVEDTADGLRSAFLAGEDAQACRDSQRWVLLGLREGQAVFAAELADPSQASAYSTDQGSAGGGRSEPPPLPRGRFEELRGLFSHLPAAEAAVLAQARGLLHWRGRTLFCAVCGAPTRADKAGHVAVCTACATQHFPRTDPAVIMLVVRDDQALLGHAHRFARDRMYSTLAGFVEPGESLEEAVAREVLEEAGVRVHDVRYHSSQPWPFPASLMVGFYADTADVAVKVEDEELRDACWFSREQIRDCERHGFELPGHDSIARHLIDDWVAAG